MSFLEKLVQYFCHGSSAKFIKNDANVVFQEFFTQKPFSLSIPNFGNTLSLSRTNCQKIIGSVSLIDMELLDTKHGKSVKSLYVWAPGWACGTGGTTLKFFLQVLHNVN